MDSGYTRTSLHAKMSSRYLPNNELNKYEGKMNLNTKMNAMGQENYQATY